MNATIRIRRAQLRAAMTPQCAQLIAALREGHRSVYTSDSSTQRAALAGITRYWTSHALSPRPTGHDSPSAGELAVSLFDNPVISQGEIAVS